MGEASPESTVSNKQRKRSSPQRRSLFVRSSVWRGELVRGAKHLNEGFAS